MAFRTTSTRPRISWIVPLALWLSLVGAIVEPRAARAASEGPVRRTTSVAVDLVLLRPLGLVRLIAGSVLLAPTTLMWPPSYRENVEIFVLEPNDYLFRRPLGEDLAGR